MKQKAFCSWSGGKDSCLALNRAIKNGCEVTHLLTMFDETGMRSRSHSVSQKVMQAQANALGLELITPNASWQSYEIIFIEELKLLKAQNFDAAIFGDIDLQPHRDWEEKVCAAAESKPFCRCGTKIVWIWSKNSGAKVFVRSSSVSTKNICPKSFAGAFSTNNLSKIYPKV